MIAGLLSIDQGEIRLNGISVKERPLEVKRKIGLVPQDLALYEAMTAAENVTFCQTIRTARETVEGEGAGIARICRASG